MSFKLFYSEKLIQWICAVLLLKLLQAKVNLTNIKYIIEWKMSETEINITLIQCEENLINILLLLITGHGLITYNFIYM